VPRPLCDCLAEFERELIRARTDDGRRRAKARGVKFGRPVNCKVPIDKRGTKPRVETCEWRNRLMEVEVITAFCNALWSA
jgi:DNA invertase Pin-like site-specific DNA recombinase